jgi:hypothetical protein
MQKIATIGDITKFPGAHHVSNQGPVAPDYYVAYGASNMDAGIAVLRALGGGKYLVEAEKDVLDKLGTTEDVQTAIDAGTWPIYETVRATKDAAGKDTTSTTVGAKPTTVDGKTVISTKPALDSALGKMTALTVATKSEPLHETIKG